jgi:acetyl esterase/lipase
LPERFDGVILSGLAPSGSDTDLVSDPYRMAARRQSSGMLRRQPVASEELDTVRELLRGLDLDSLSIAERRAATESVAAQPPPGTTVEPVDAGGVPAEWVVATGVPAGRVLLYLHGGAYQIGSPATLRHMIALISAAAQAQVLSIDYRLAPEHPFPSAVDDALMAYRFLLRGGADPAAIAIAGDSAGGGLALATLVALRDAGDSLPAAGVAVSPSTDLALTGESMRSRADIDVMIRPAGLAETAATYLAGADPRHPYASPLYADLRGLPPILIHVGDAEVILDDSTRFAAKARAEGVDVTLEIWAEMPHVWHAFAGLLPESDRAIERIGNWLQARCPGAPPPPEACLPRCGHTLFRRDSHPNQPGVEIVDVAGCRDPLRYLRRSQQAFHVCGDGLLRIDNSAVCQGGLIQASSGRVGVTEVRIREESGAAACVVDDRYLEQGSLGIHDADQVADERDVVDDSFGDPPACVAHHGRIAQAEAQKARRVDSRVKAGDHEDRLIRHDRQAGVSSGGCECRVALQERIELAHLLPPTGISMRVAATACPAGGISADSSGTGAG